MTDLTLVICDVCECLISVSIDSDEVYAVVPEQSHTSPMAAELFGWLAHELLAQRIEPLHQSERQPLPPMPLMPKSLVPKSLVPKARSYQQAARIVCPNCSGGQIEEERKEENQDEQDLD